MRHFLTHASGYIGGPSWQWETPTKRGTETVRLVTRELDGSVESVASEQTAMDNLSDHLPDQQLSDYLLGQLPDDAQQAVEDHLEECPECEARAAEATPTDALVELLHRAAVTSAPATASSAFGNTLSSRFDSTPGDHPSTVCSEGFVTGASPKPPTALSGHRRYRILRLLGWGGMGSVWLAEHLVMGRPVALKVIRPELLAKAGTLERFRREVQAAAKLNHPHIAQAYDAEQIGDTHFLVMEYVAGHPLSERVKSGPLPIAEACRAVRDAALGLAHAHAAGLVHRDVKPGNLIQTDQGTVKVLDFGLAISADADSAITGENLVMGTPDYVAPEQAEDPHAADARSDLYSLGCTLYHLLSGRVPFADGSVIKKIDAHRGHDPEPIAEIPQSLWRIIAKMMAKDPAERFETALEVAEALHQFSFGSIEPWQSQKLTNGQFDSRHREATSPLRTSLGWRRLLISVLLLSMVLGIEIYRSQNHRGERGGVSPLVDGQSHRRAGTIPLAENREGDADSSTRFPILVSQGQRIVGHTRRVRHVAWSPDSQSLFSASDDGTVRRWKRTTGEQTGRFDHGRNVRIFSVSVIDDGNTILTTTDDRVRIWDVASQQELPGFPAVTPKVELTFAATNPQGTLAATGSVSGVVRVWEIARREILHEWPVGNDKPVYFVAWTPDGDQVLAGFDFGLKLFNVQTKAEQAMDDDKGGWTQVDMARDGNAVAGCHWSGDVELFDRRTGKLTSLFWGGNSEGKTTARIAFLPDGRLLTSGRGSFVDLWSPQTEARLAVLEGHVDQVIAIAASPDGNWIASAGEDSEVRVWSTPQFDSEAMASLPPNKPLPVRAMTDLRLIRNVTDYRETHGANLPELRMWLAELPAGFHPTAITSRAGSRPPRFDAIAIHDGRQFEFQAQLDLDRSGVHHLQDFRAFAESGWNLLHACTYQDDSEFPRHHLWVNDGRDLWVHGISLAKLPEHLANWKRDDFRPVGYYLDAVDPGRGSPLRSYGVFVAPNKGVDWTASLELNPRELACLMTEARQQQRRPEVLCAIGSGDDRTFAVTLIPNPTDLKWYFRSAMTVSEFEAELIEQRLLGRRPQTVLSEDRSNIVNYTALWIEYSPRQP